VYDDANRLTEVNDLGTGVKTTYSYDINGQRVTETTTTPDGAHNRTITYEYDAVGQMTRWADAETGGHTNYQWDSAGNLHRAYTDVGYDPEVRNVDLTSVLSEVEDEIRSIRHTPYPGTEEPKYQGSLNNILRERAVDLGVDLGYYDRVFDLQSAGYDFGQVGGPEGVQLFEWDVNVSERRAALYSLLSDMGYQAKLDEAIIDPNYRFVDQRYQYDDNNRVTQINNGTELDTQYGYDVAGNRVMVNNGGQITEYTFDANGRVTESHSNGNKTADWQYDNVGNVQRFRTFKSDGAVDKVTTKQYYENNVNYYTNDDGQQTTMTMDKSGRVTRTKLVDDGDTFYFDHKYNAAGLETRVNARGKDVGGRTINTYDSNDNLIVADKGEGDSQDRKEVLKFVYNNDNQILYRFHDTGKNEDVRTETEYLYANSKAVGETGNDVKGENVTKLGTGNYNLVQPMGEDFPSSAVTFVTASEGDNLQSIAAAVYGNPSLWFVLAEANGLEPGQSLKEGQRIEVPNTVKTGSITAETHKVYDESEIVGSTLPNLKSDPKDKGCGSFLAIIIVAVIAVVAVYAVAALAATGAFAAAGGGLAAATGGLVSAQVGAFVLAGAVVGAAASAVQQGLFIALGYQEDFSWKSVAAGAVAGALSGAAQSYAQAAKVAEAAGQTVGYAKTAARALQVSSAASKQLVENGKITNWSSLAAAGLGSVKGVDGSGEVSALVGPVGAGSALEYVTPWLGAAESFIRTGEVSPTSWASAVSSTLSTAASGLEGLKDTVLPGGELTGGQLLSNVVAGGVLNAYDRDAGQAYFESVIGNEVGSWIGGGIAQASGLGSRAAGAFNAEVSRLKSETPAPNSRGGVSLEENLAAGGIDLRRPQGTGGAERLMGSQPTPVEPETYTLEQGDNPWSVAQGALGSDASDAEVQEYVYRLISANPDLLGANTRTLQPGMTLTLPTEDQQVSAAALGTYAGDEAFGQVANIREQLMAGGSFDPNTLGRLQSQFERAGLPFDAQLDMQSSQRTLGYQSRTEDIAMGQLVSTTPVLENQLSVSFQLNGSGLSFDQMNYELGETDSYLYGALPMQPLASTSGAITQEVISQPESTSWTDSLSRGWNDVSDVLGAGTLILAGGAASAFGADEFSDNAFGAATELLSRPAQSDLKGGTVATVGALVGGAQSVGEGLIGLGQLASMSVQEQAYDMLGGEFGLGKRVGFLQENHERYLQLGETVTNSIGDFVSDVPGSLESGYDSVLGSFDRFGDNFNTMVTSENYVDQFFASTEVGGFAVDAAGAATGAYGLARAGGKLTGDLVQTMSKYDVRSPFDMTFRPGQLNSGIPLQSPLIRNTGEAIPSNSGPSWVNLSDVRSTQATVSIRAGDGTPVLNMASDMKLNGWDLSKGVPDLVRLDDGFMTLDHRRLVAADWAGLDRIPANIHGFDEVLPNSFTQSGRFSSFESPVAFSDLSTRTSFYKGDLPETWGQAGMIRSLQQQERFGQFPLTGSSELPSFTFKDANDWAKYINNLQRLQSQ
jgi:YD repeat-containing protein